MIEVAPGSPTRPATTALAGFRLVIVTCKSEVGGVVTVMLSVFSSPLPTETLLTLMAPRICPAVTVAAAVVLGTFGAVVLAVMVAFPGINAGHSNRDGDCSRRNCHRRGNGGHAGVAGAEIDGQTARGRRG